MYTSHRIEPAGHLAHPFQSHELTRNWRTWRLLSVSDTKSRPARVCYFARFVGRFHQPSGTQFQSHPAIHPSIPTHSSSICHSVRDGEKVASHGANEKKQMERKVDCGKSTLSKTRSYVKLSQSIWVVNYWFDLHFRNIKHAAIYIYRTFNRFSWNKYVLILNCCKLYLYVYEFAI